MDARVDGGRTSRALDRERLLPLLDRAAGARVVSVVGPAGCGKTTVLRQLAARSQVAVWLGGEAIDEGSSAVARRMGPDELLVLDDLHLADQATAADLLSIALDPGGPRIALGGRCEPAVELSLLRVDGALVEIDAEDLRFRSWEVEQLFRQVYDRPLAPQEVGPLSSRTGGWVAGLHLFHLATEGLAPSERAEVLGNMAVPSRHVRAYLAGQVIAHLPDDLRRFLLDTSVLGWLAPACCDELRGADGSLELLEELERRQVFIDRARADGEFRYHEVLRTFLESALIEELGPAGVRQRYLRAGEVLQAWDRPADAFLAYLRGGAETRAAALLGPRFGPLDGRTGWLDGVPARMVAHDPWLQLAHARRCLRSGQLRDALAAYARAVQDGAGALADVASSERAVLSAVLEARTNGPAWLQVLRRAVTDDPHGATLRSRQLDGDLGRLVGAVAALLDGDVDAAPGQLEDLATWSTDDVVAAVAGLLVPVATVLAGGPPPEPPSVAGLAERAERCGLPWVGRLAMALLCLDGSETGRAEAAAVRRGCEAAGDPIGSVFVRCIESLGAPGGTESLRSLVEATDRMGFTALAVTARATSRTRADESTVARSTAPNRATVTCFGGFRVDVDGRSLDLQFLRPQARSLLRLLVAHAGAPVHREVLSEALWPERDPDRARRILQVTVSSVRQLFAQEPSLGRIERDGDSYRFDPGAASVDVIALGALDQQARRSTGRAREATLVQLVDLYRGELLPEEGPADWVLPLRRAAETAVVGAFEELAMLRLAAGDPTAAAHHARRGLALDPDARGLLHILAAAQDDVPARSAV